MSDSDIKKAWDNGYENGLSTGAQAERERLIDCGSAQAYANGLTDGMRAERERIINMAERMANEDPAVRCQMFVQWLKQRLGGIL